MFFRPYKSRNQNSFFEKLQRIELLEESMAFLCRGLCYKPCFVKVAEVEAYTGDPSFMAQSMVNPKTFSLHGCPFNSTLSSMENVFLPLMIFS